MSLCLAIFSPATAVARWQVRSGCDCATAIRPIRGPDSKSEQTPQVVIITRPPLSGLSLSLSLARSQSSLINSNHFTDWLLTNYICVATLLLHLSPLHLSTDNRSTQIILVQVLGGPFLQRVIVKNVYSVVQHANFFAGQIPERLTGLLCTSFTFIDLDAKCRLKSKFGFRGWGAIERETDPMECCSNSNKLHLGSRGRGTRMVHEQVLQTTSTRKLTWSPSSHEVF